MSKIFLKSFSFSSRKVITEFSDNLVSELSTIFQHGVIPEIDSKKLYAKAQKLDFKREFRYASFDDYENGTKSRDDARQFLSRVFDEKNPPNCSLDVMCKQPSCEVCVSLFGLFFGLRYHARSEWSSIYYQYLVNAFFFLAHTLSRKISYFSAISSLY